MPLKETSVSANEAPCMDNSLKRLIRRRQKALTNNNVAKYNQLWNKVNRDRKACRAKYYDAKVKDLKQLVASLKSSARAPSQTSNTLPMRGKILNIWPMLSMTPFCHQ